MNRKIVFIFIGFILSTVFNFIWGKQAIVVFSSDTNISVQVYAPLDGTCNFSIVSDQFDLKQNIRVSYEVEVLNFCFMKLVFSNGTQSTLIIQEDDKIYISISDNKIEFNGSNAIGNYYLNNFSRYAPVDSIFDAHLNPHIDVGAINSDLYDIFWKGLEDDLRQMDNDSSYKFNKIIYNDMKFAVSGMLIRDYKMILSGFKGEITKADSLNIISQIDSIYLELNPLMSDIVKYRFTTGVLYSYYRDMYDRLSLNEKNELCRNYGNGFGPYVIFLLAPYNIQMPSLGSAFMTNLMYGFSEFDKDEVFRHIKKNFPNSQYFELIKSYMDPDQINNINNYNSNDSIVFIDEDVSTLEELFSLDRLKGDRLYITLWATWCLPCKNEFMNTSNVKKMTDKYGVKLVYISIDDLSSEDKWRSDISKYNLLGYHLILNESLKKDIIGDVYNGNVALIPKYVYVNKEGVIVNSDAPRPSSVSAIEEMILKSLPFD